MFTAKEVKKTEVSIDISDEVWYNIITTTERTPEEMTNLAYKNQGLLNTIKTESIYNKKLEKITLSDVIRTSRIEAGAEEIIAMIQKMADNNISIQQVSEFIDKSVAKEERIQKRVAKFEAEIEENIEPSVPVRDFTPEEEEKLCDYFREKADLPYVKYKKVSLLYIQLSYNWMRRAGDIVKLKNKDVMIDKDTPRERLLMVEKKTGKTANLKINPTVKEILKEHFSLSDYYDPEDWLFPTAHDMKKHYSVDSARKMIQRACIECGIPVRFSGKDYNGFDRSVGNVGTHSQRKGMATKLFEMSEDAGQDALLISHALNHSSVETTERYIGLTQKKIDDLLEKGAVKY